VEVQEAEPDPTPVEEPSEPVDARVPPLPPMSRTGLPAGDSRPHGSRWRVLAPLVVIAVIAAVVVIALGSGGDDGSGGGGGGQKVAEKSSDKGSGQSEAESGSGGETSTVDSGTTDASTGLPAVTDPDPERGYQLNAEGKQQLDAGDYEGAVATLEDAVAAYPEDSTDINYAYALFNYAQALRLSGNPEAAIPVLKKRLTFDDQTETVQAELEAARAAAG